MTPDLFYKVTKGTLGKKFSGHKPDPRQTLYLALVIMVSVMAWSVGLASSSLMSQDGLWGVVATTLVCIVLYYRSDDQAITSISVCIVHLGLSLLVGQLFVQPHLWGLALLPSALGIAATGWLLYEAPHEKLGAEFAGMTYTVIAFGVIGWWTEAWLTTPQLVGIALSIYLFLMFRLMRGTYMTYHNLPDYGLLPITLPVAWFATGCVTCTEHIKRSLEKRPYPYRH
jgi:hypothetical protein